MKTDKIFALALATLCSLPLTAREWSLDECINYAIDHNITVKQSELDHLNAENSVTEARDAFLPAISGGASQSWSFGRGLTADNTYANLNTSSFGWRVGLDLPLFEGLQNVRQLAYAKANLAAAFENFEAAKDNVTLQVIAQYLQILFCDEIAGVAQSQVNLASELLEAQKSRLELGKIPEADMLDARSQLAQAQVQLTNALNDRTMARLNLIQMLRLNESPEDFSVTPLSGESPMLVPPSTVYDSALGVNHALLAMKSRITAADKAVKLSQSGWLPRLNLSAGLSSNYYTLEGRPSESFGQQMRHNFSPSIGLSLSVPIFDRFSTRNSVRRAKVQKLAAELSYDSSADELLKTVNQAYYQAVGAQEKLTSATAATEATSKAMEAMLEKYTLGRATATDYDTARNAYIKAESERLQAKYELQLRARILNFYRTGR